MKILVRILAVFLLLMVYKSHSQELVARYTFDNTLTNSTTISGLNAGITGSSSFGTDRCNNANASLGVFTDDQELTVSGTNSALSITSSITMSSWFYTYNNTINQIIVSKNGNATNPTSGYFMGVYSGGVIRGGIYDGLGNSVTTPSTFSGTVMNGVWVHVAVVWNGATRILTTYSNGVMVGTNSGANITVIGTNTVPMKIGASSWTATDRFVNGFIDDLRIYNYALTSSDISNLYSSYAAVTSISGVASAGVCENSTQIFTINTLSGQSFGFNWYRNGSIVSNGGGFSGANTSSLSVTGVPLSFNGSSFSVSVTGACQSATMGGANLTVTALSSALLNPQTIETCIGTNLVFQLASISGVSNQYQWFKDGIALSNSAVYSGVNSTQLTLTGIGSSNDGFYTASISGLCGSMTTGGVSLSTRPITAILSTLSGSLAVCEGLPLQINVQSIDGHNLQFRWLKNNVLINQLTDSGIYGNSFTTTGLSLSGTNLALNGAEYLISATGFCGSAIANTTLTVNALTSATNPTTTVETCAGSSFTLNLGTIQGTNLVFGWYKDWAKITTSEGGLYSNFTTSGLGFNNVPLSLTGNYFAVVSGLCSEITTTGTTITANPLNSISSITVSSANICEGSAFQLGFQSISGVNLKYQWLKNGNPLSAISDGGIYGSSFSTTGLVFSNALLSLSGENYAVSVVGFCPSIVSSSVNPLIKTTTSANMGISSLFTCVGSNNTISINTINGYNLSYTWYKDGTIISNSEGGLYAGFTTSGITINNIPLSFSGSLFAVVTGDCDPGAPVTTSGVAISVSNVTSLLGLSMANIDTCPGASFNIQVMSTTGSLLSYQWLKNGGALSSISDGGIYGNSFSVSGITFSGVSAGLNGFYTLSASGLCGAHTVGGANVVARQNTQISAITSDANYCQGTTKTFSFTSISGYNIGYNWAFGDAGGPYNILSNNNSLTGFGGNVNGVNNSQLTVSGMPSGLTGKVFVASATGFCNVAIATVTSPVQNPNLDLAFYPTSVVSSCVNIRYQISASVTGGNIARWYGKRNGAYNWTPLTNNQRLPDISAGGPPSTNTVSGVFGDVLTVNISNTNSDQVQNYQFAISAVGTCGTMLSTTTGLLPFTNTSFYPITLNVLSLPEIVLEPVSSATCLGSSLTFNMAGAGSGINIYQWYRGNNTVTGIKLTATSDGGIYGSSFSTTGLNINANNNTLSGNNYFAVFTSSCGTTTTGLAMLTVHTVPSASVALSSVSTCPGYNAIIPGSANSVPPLSLVWQLSTNGGSNFDDLTEGGNFINTTTTSLRLSNIPPSFSNYRFKLKASNYCGVTTTTSVLYTSRTVPLADFFTLKSRYCNNEGASELVSASNFTTAGGSFISNPVVAGLLTPSSAGRVNFNPNVITTPSALSVTYLSQTNSVGCVSTVTYATFVNLMDTLDFYGPSLTQYISNSGVVADLEATPTVNGIGSFSGGGVVGNKFYVDLIPNVGTVNVAFTYQNTITGCSETQNRTFDIQNTFNRFIYSPSVGQDNRPTVSGIVLNNRFCIDDNTQYNVSITSPISSVAQLTQAPRFNDFNITSFGSPMLTNTLASINLYSTCGLASLQSVDRNDIVSYRLTPSNAIRAGSYIARCEVDVNSTNCVLPLTTRIDLTLINNPLFNEGVTVLGLSPLPSIASGTTTFCGPITNINDRISIAGQNLTWYYNNTITALNLNTNNPSYAQLESEAGISLAPSFTPYRFYIRQNSNGCRSRFFPIDILVYPKPSVPVRVTKDTLKYCKGENFSSFAATVSTTVSGAGFNWYSNPSKTNLLQTGATLSQNLNTNVVTVIPYFVATNDNGCESNLLNYTLEVQSLPNEGGIVPLVTLSGPFCVNTIGGIVPVFKSSIAIPKVENIRGRPVEFKWFSSASTLEIATTSVDGVLPLPNDTLYTTEYQPEIYLSSVTSESFYVRFAFSDGEQCRGDASTISKFDVYGIPSAPVLSSESALWSSIDNTLGPLCNNVTIDGITAKSSENFASFTWYSDVAQSNTISGNATYFAVITSTSATTNDFYVTQKVNGCESPATKTSIIRLEQLVTPGFILPTPNFYCTAQTSVKDITVTGIANTLVGFVWYSDSTLTTTLARGETYNPQASTVAGFSSFFVSQTLDRCESAPTKVMIEYRQTPQTPQTLDFAYCLGQQVPNATVIGASVAETPIFKWYEDKSKVIFINNGATVAGGNVRNISDLSAYTFPTTLSGANQSTTFYVTQTVRECESEISPVSFYTVNIPEQPKIISNTNAYCSGSTLANLVSQEISGADVKWYKDSKTNFISNDNDLNINVFPKNIVWNQAQLDSLHHRFYLTQVFNSIDIPSRLSFSGCESAPDSLDINIYPFPPQPTVAQKGPYCGQGGLLVDNITVSGFNHPSLSLAWYDDAVGNNLIIRSSEINPNGFVSNPNPLTDSTLTLLYATQEIKGCRSATREVKVIIYPTPVINFTGLAAAYCDYSNPFTVTGVPLATSNQYATYFMPSSIAGTGLQTITGGLAVLNPTNMVSGTGNIPLTYFFRNQYGCENSLTRQFRINQSPVVSFGQEKSTGIEALDDIICINTSEIIKLSPAPTGGTFAVNNTPAGDIFDPSTYGLGKHRIEYTYTDPSTNCTASFRDSTIVREKPTAEFAFSTVCTNDTIAYLNLSSVSGGNLTNYEWTGINYSFNSTVSSPAFTFRRFGDYTTKLAVTSEFGCRDEITKAIKIGRRADIGLSWLKTCADQTTEFVNTTSLPAAAGNIIRYEWFFDDASTPLVSSTTSEVVTRKFNTTGEHTLKLNVVTDNNCAKDTTVSINIVPKITARSYPYSATFDSDNGGWYTIGRNNSWALDAFESKLFKGSNNKYWSTGGLGTYSQAENSFIYGPCFDLSLLSRPMVSLNIASENFAGADGAVLQYSLDNGQSWQVLGDVNTGINWYNEKDITSNPGEQLNFNLGWSGVLSTSGGNWLNSRHSLDTLSGRDNVWFRLGFSSIDQENSLKGFGFDDFQIGSRNKNVLVESFVNSSDLNSNDQMARKIEATLNKNNKDAIGLNYFTSFPSANTFNTANPADPSARVLFYSIQSVPRSVVDGNQFSGLSVLLDNNSIVKRSLESAKFDLNMRISNNGTQINAELEIVPLEDYGDDNTELVSYIAVVERDVTGVIGTGGKSSFDWVNRKMLPDAAGELFRGKMTKGGTRSVAQNWAIDNSISNKNNLGVVAYLQNNKTKEILQAGYNGPKMYVSTFTGAISSAITAENISDKDVLIYPNPATDELNIQFNRELAKKMDFAIYDFLGNKIESGFIPKESLEIKVRTADYPNGMYFVRIGSLVKKVTIVK